MGLASLLVFILQKTEPLSFWPHRECASLLRRHCGAPGICSIRSRTRRGAANGAYYAPNEPLIRVVIRLSGHQASVGQVRKFGAEIAPP